MKISFVKTQGEYFYGSACLRIAYSPIPGMCSVLRNLSSVQSVYTKLQELQAALLKSKSPLMNQKSRNFFTATHTEAESPKQTFTLKTRDGKLGL